MKLKDLDFRIWHKESGYLDDPAYIFYQFCVEKDFDECFKHKCFDEMKVELWSGLIDKNGRKIFEGDIVALSGDTRKMIYLPDSYKKNKEHIKILKTEAFRIYLTEYTSPLITFDILTLDETLGFPLQDVREFNFKIIGNIHEKIKTHKCYQDSIKRLSLKVGSKELQNEFCQKEAMNGN